MKKHLLKRITPIIALAVILCIVAVCFISGTAATEYNSGDWKYTVSNGKATVTGYTGTETTLNFPTTLGGYPVDSIGYSAIKNNARVNSVIIPEGYGSIEDSAFYGCEYLNSASIPNSIKSIGSNSFQDCIRLESVMLAEGGTSTATIGGAAFKGCTALKSITIPANYKNTGGYAFEDCKRLQTVTIKENSSQNLERTIDAHSFDSCTALTEINIPEGFVFVGDYAFYGCSYLKKASIPKSIQNIGTYSGSSFEKCIRLETVVFAEGGITTATIQRGSFKECTALKSIIIPENYKDIGYEAFFGCTNLQTVIIEENSDKDFERTIDDNSFKGCTALSEINIPEGYVSIGFSAFYGCSNLKSVSIPKSVQNIGTDYGRSFEKCTSLETITFAEGGTAEIQMLTFKGCTSLKSIVIPASCKYIGLEAFLDCTSLHTVIIKENSDPYFERTIDVRSFKGCLSLSEINIPEGYVSIGDSAFYGCSNLKKVSVSNSVQDIGTNCFEKCISLETVIFAEDGMATIPLATFRGCTALKSIIIPSNYKDIGYEAFYGCTNLQTVIIKDSDDPYLERIIDGNSFKGCTALTMVHIPANIESIDDTAFNNRSADLVICSTSYECVAKTYADANGISFVLCNGEHELPVIPDTPVVTTYTLSYDANGGSGAPAVQSGATTYTISTTVPVRSGYKFLGWAFDKNETSASCVGGANITVSADTVLYAVWEKIPDEPTTEPTEPAIQPSTVPATQPTTRPTEPTTKPAQPTTKPTEPVTEPSTMKPAVIVKIKTPSQSTINYGDSIILHADTENLPEGAYIEWSVSSGNFKIVSRSVDSKNCTITPEATGDTVFTATVYDADGNEISSDTQTMTAKAGFFQKIIAFFKKLFGLTKVIPEAFKF